MSLRDSPLCRPGRHRPHDVRHDLHGIPARDELGAKLGGAFAHQIDDIAALFQVQRARILQAIGRMLFEQADNGAPGD